MQTRNQNPFALATGLPLPPMILAAGKWQFDASLNIANTELDVFRDDSSLLFDAETRETRVSATYAFNDHWNLRASISHLWIGDGILDGPIEGFHRAFGFDNGDRGQLGDRAPVIEVRRDGNLLYALQRANSGAGPLLVDLTRGWRFDDQRHAGLSFGIKLPTGHAERLSDSGGTDISLSGFFMQPFGDRLEVGARIGILRRDGTELLGDLARTHVPFASALLRYRLGEHWSAVVQSDAHGPLYRDLPGFLSSSGNQLNFGLSRRVGEHAEFEASLGEDLPALLTTDVVVHFNLRLHP